MIDIKAKAMQSLLKSVVDTSSEYLRLYDNAISDGEMMSLKNDVALTKAINHLMKLLESIDQNKNLIPKDTDKLEPLLKDMKISYVDERELLTVQERLDRFPLVEIKEHLTEFRSNAKRLREYLGME